MEIIEIGICVLDLETLAIEKPKSIIVKPNGFISDFCTQLTSITQDMVDRDGIALQNALNLIQKEYNVSSKVWGSWGDFDRNQFFKECGFKRIRYPFGPQHINLKTIFSITYGFRQELGMPEALNHLGISLDGTHHRGLDDALNIAKLCQKMFEKMRQ